jgi:hypothetical protein
MLGGIRHFPAPCRRALRPDRLRTHDGATRHPQRQRLRLLEAARAIGKEAASHKTSNGRPIGWDATASAGPWRNDLLKAWGGREPRSRRRTCRRSGLVPRAPLRRSLMVTRQAHPISRTPSPVPPAHLPPGGGNRAWGPWGAHSARFRTLVVDNDATAHTLRHGFSNNLIADGLMQKKAHHRKHAVRRGHGVGDQRRQSQRLLLPSTLGRQEGERCVERTSFVRWSRLSACLTARSKGWNWASEQQEDWLVLERELLDQSGWLRSVPDSDARRLCQRRIPR